MKWAISYLVNVSVQINLVVVVVVLKLSNIFRAIRVQPRSQGLFPTPSQGKGPGNEVDPCPHYACKVRRCTFETCTVYKVQTQTTPLA